MNNFEAKNTALITGASGYIGSNLVRKLFNLGWEIHVLVRPNSNVRVLEGFIGKIYVHIHDGTTQNLVELVKLANPQVVFHLASMFLAQHTSEDVEGLITNNVLFSNQLIEAMKINGVRYMINTGTSWQHYENENYNPVNLYAGTKQAFESIIEYYTRAHGLNVITLSLFDTYGPNDTRKKLIPLLWDAALNKQTLLMSPGEQLINLVYIEDVLDAFLTAVNTVKNNSGIGAHTSYGVGLKNPMKLKEIVYDFQRITGEKISVEFGSREYREREVMVPWVDYECVPGWQPKFDLETGLVLTRPNVVNSPGN